MNSKFSLSAPYRHSPGFRLLPDMGVREKAYSVLAGVNLLSTSVGVGPSDIDCTFCYAVPLVPNFWETICQDRGKPFSLPRDGRVRWGLAFPKRPFVQLTSFPPTDATTYSIIPLNALDQVRSHQASLNSEVSGQGVEL